MKPAKIWANLAVEDLTRTADFYSKLGFNSNMSRHSDDLTSFCFGEKDFVIHFFTKKKLQVAIGGNLSNLNEGNEIIFSMSADTKEEVDQWVDKAKNAGGTIFREASSDENGFYYCGFADPDGHKFNVLLVEAGM